MGREAQFLTPPSGSPLLQNTSMHVWTPPPLPRPSYRQTCTSYTFTHPYPPPTSCLCSDLEWLVFHFASPGALQHSLTWPVYHYWSLSLTWTNRGLFSKVVSQVAVTDVSGHCGAQGLAQKFARMWARLHCTGSTVVLITRSVLQGGCLGV